MRDAYPEESTEANAKCRIDHPGLQFVVEDSSTVVKAENSHIGELTLPSDKPVRFNGTASRGPVRLVSGHPLAAQSALYTSDKIQYIAETPEAVRHAVAAAGGAALPVPSGGFFAGVANVFSKFNSRPKSGADGCRRDGYGFHEGNNAVRCRGRSTADTYSFRQGPDLAIG
ncbi:hypothetical protein [Bradyrhizobium sp. CCGB01]|uniref:hypothetical protein n=1 Tax=Bradyrhizobium sp. CCGB01 TaxID=2949634 RepID=UPI0020B37E18|nr:hypothetical protein [Bradyrhizobium sp. CCGB01]MCP3406181.1 hypothetical protein [Bradyrhizobium sp. CCGB01]